MSCVYTCVLIEEGENQVLGETQKGQRGSLAGDFFYTLEICQPGIDRHAG